MDENPPETPDAPGTPTTRPWYQRLASWRRGAAGVLFVAGAAFLFAGLVPDRCSGHVAGTTVVRLCEPVSVTDPRFLVALLAFLLLLLPDLSELEIAGVLRLKRTIEETRRETNELKSELATIRVQAMATAQATNVTRIGMMPADVKSMISDLIHELKGGDIDTALAPSEQRGAFSFIAFLAGFEGLLGALFEEWSPDVTLVGLTIDEHGNLDATYLSGAVSNEDVLAVIDALPAPTASPGPVLVDLDTRVAAAAHAYAAPDVVGDEGNDGRVGALIAIVQEPSRAAAFSDDDRDALAGAVDTAASAYARLLCDLLREPTAEERGLLPTGQAQ